MFQIYSFCRQVDDIADSDGPRDERLAALQQWRDDIDALYQGSPPRAAEGLRRLGEDLRPASARISSPSSTAWRWTCRRISARPTWRRSISIAIASRAPWGGCRCGCSAWREEDGIAARASSRPRAAIHQHPARHRRGRGPRPALSAARGAAACRHHHRRSRTRHRRPRAAKSVHAAGERAQKHFEKADEIMNRNPRRVVRAPRIMSKYYRAILDLLIARGFAAPRTPVRVSKMAKHRHSPSLRVHLMQKTVHIIGAGISGLSAAVRLANAGFSVHVHEATQQAGGRCRSYFDAATNLTIDNGNHLLLSGNRHALRLCRGRSAPKRAWSALSARSFRSSISRPASAGQLDLGDGRLPLWVFDESAPRPRHRPARLSGAGAADLGRHRQAGRQCHPLRGHAVSAPGAAAAAGGAQRRSARRARRGLPARSCGKRCCGRPGLPAADRARRPELRC